MEREKRKIKRLSGLVGGKKIGHWQAGGAASMIDWRNISHWLIQEMFIQ